MLVLLEFRRSAAHNRVGHCWQRWEQRQLLVLVLLVLVLLVLVLLLLALVLLLMARPFSQEARVFDCEQPQPVPQMLQQQETSMSPSTMTARRHCAIRAAPAPRL